MLKGDFNQHRVYVQLRTQPRWAEQGGSAAAAAAPECHQGRRGAAAALEWHPGVPSGAEQGLGWARGSRVTRVSSQDQAAGQGLG